jgi:MerR family transcriptional regulator, copper efflux regulator
MSSHESDHSSATSMSEEVSILTPLQMNTTIPQRLKIGDLAKRSQVSVGTLRYYESLGLISPIRAENNYRYYSSETLQQVQFIKKAQALNFSLADIQRILNLRNSGESPCHLVDQLLDEKIEQLEQQIQSAIAFKQELETFRDRVAKIPPTAPSDPSICQHISAVSLT